MKPKNNILLVFFSLIIFFTLGIRATNHTTPQIQIRDKYLSYLNEFDFAAKALENAVKRNYPPDTLQKKFIQMRSSFKKAEMFIEYYFPYQIYLLNAPAIQSAEEKKPPQGMQVIEDMIFSPDKPIDRKSVISNIQAIKGSIIYLKDNINEITADSLIVDTMLEEVYRITALGLSGFDSPISKNAIPEVAASIESIRDIHEISKTLYKKYSIKGIEKIDILIGEGILYCNQNKDFDSFDRMFFIRKYLNPIAIWFGDAKVQIGIKDKLRSNLLFAGPLINKYYSLFDARVFSAGFYTSDSLYQHPGKIALGKKLFFDPILSGNNQRSCATCHNPQKTFTDGLTKSLTIDGHSPVKRNAPTLWNSALQRDLFYDNRQQFMEELVIEVLGNTAEMNSSAQLVTEKLKKREDYVELFQNVYMTNGLNSANIANAISSYVRSLISLNTKFDLHMNGRNIMGKNEIRGFNLFMGKAKCGTCHFVPLFSGSKPPHYYIIESEVIGVPLTKDTLNAVIDPDKGRIHMTGALVHEFSFKTPGLRNVAKTAPYMHNGVFSTLEEVVDFYDKGGGAGLGINLPNQTLPADKLNLTKGDKADIVAFLKCLTDTKYPSH